MSRRAVIGFDRKIELDWLDATAARVAEGMGKKEVRAFLHEYLNFLAPGGKNRSGGAQGKTASVLVRVWSHVRPEAAPLRDRAVKLLPEVGPEDRLPLHWAMVITAYPFFMDHGDAIGRLLGLQESFTASQIRRRISAQWGERSTVTRTSAYVIRSMVAWGVLADASRGSYRRGRDPRPIAGDLAAVLAEAVLLASEQKSLPLAQVRQHPALFPFAVRVSGHELRRSARMQVVRQGLDMDMVTLAT